MPHGRTPGGAVVLIGFMASGKSEVGRCIARKLGGELVDTDALVESAGLSIQDIFASEGEQGFRRRETHAVKAAAKFRPAVISAGGGTVLSEANVTALRRAGVLVYLDTSEDELWERLSAATGRPLIDGERGSGSSAAQRRRRLRDLLAARRPIYEAVADVVVTTSGRTPEGVADEILSRLQIAGSAANPATVVVDLEPPYTVTVGRGLLGRVSAVAGIPDAVEKVAVVTHPRVRRLWGEALTEGLARDGRKVTVASFPEGEDRKGLETASRLYRRLAAAGFHRGDIVVVLGGGVAGDVGGFVASTYARGIPFVQVPTTLLAMVDASIGGKTGVNLKEGKNLVGTFAQPAAVVADLDTLRTLPERELRGGLAEVVKYALIADPDLGVALVDGLDGVLARDDSLQPLVARSAAIKAEFVAADEREAGRRMHLNYGHTLGHAVEAASLAGTVGSPRGRGYHHGEAIAIGMHFAAWLSVLTGIAGRELIEHHVEMLSAVGLPLTLRPTRLDDLMRYMNLDKKYARGPRFVLLEKPGRPVVSDPVDERLLAEALEKITEEG